MSKLGRKEAYRQYLKGKKWKKFRDEALEFHGNRCGRCGSNYNLQVHHKSYKNKFKETFADVMILCGSCHFVEHRKHRKKNKMDAETVTYYPTKSIAIK